MGTPLIAGRFFSREDGVAGHLGVVIVNEAFAKAYFPAQSSLGGRLCICYVAANSNIDWPWAAVVGVVANVRHSNLEDAPPPQIYQPFWQDGHDANRAYIAIRTSLPPAQMIPAIRRTVSIIDPSLAVANIQSMDQRVSEASALRRFQTSLFGVFAGVALFLAGIGLYGVMAYSLRQRTAEIGIRISLGARRSDVLKLMVGHGMMLTLAGILVGIAGALAFTRLLSSMLYGIAPIDPTTLVVVGMVLLAVSLIACYVPARRAMRIDPMKALRSE
jgi:predicted permease